ILDFGKPVDEGNNGHAGGPEIGGLGDGHHGEIAAVAPAHHRDFLGVDVPGLLHPLGGGDHVFQVASAHVKVVGVLKFLAIAAGAAIVRRDHEVSLVYQVLDALDK